MVIAKPNVSELKDLTDVDDSLAPSDEQILKYEDTTSEFEAVSSGSGDVVGPGSAINENLVVFNSTTGKIIKDSTVNISVVNANTAYRGVGHLPLSGGTLSSGLIVDHSDAVDSISINHTGTTKESFHAASLANDNMISLNNNFDGASTVITNLGWGRGSIATNWYYRNLASTSTAGPVMFIEQDNSGDDQNALTIQNNGTGYGLFVDQNGDAESIVSRFSNTRTTNAIDFESDDNNEIAIFGRPRTQTTGSNWLYRDLASTATAGPVLFIEQDNASDDQSALKIQNDGTGNGLFIDQNGNGIALNITSDAPVGQLIYARGVQTSNSLINVYGYGENTATSYVFGVGHGSSTGNAVNIENAGAGDGLLINQDGNGVALNIDSQATTADGLYIDTITSGKSLKIVHHSNVGVGVNILASTLYSSMQLENHYTSASNLNYVQLARHSGSANTFYRDLTSVDTSGSVVLIKQDNTGDDQYGLLIQQDGTGAGIVIDQNGNGVGLNIDSEATTAYSINITNAGSLGIDMNDTAMIDIRTAGFNAVGAAGSKTATMTLQTPLTSDSVHKIKITNGGLATLTWAAESGTVTHRGGSAPTLTSSGIDVAVCWWDGTNWVVDTSLEFS